MRPLPEVLAIAPGTVIDAPGVDKTVNRNLTLVPWGGGTRPQELHRVSWGLFDSWNLLLGSQEPH